MNIINLVKAKRTRGALVALVLSVPMLSQSLVYAQDHPSEKAMKGHERGEGMMRHMLKKMAKKLELSQSQKQQVKSIVQQAKIENSELKVTMLAFKEKNKVLMLAESFDEQAFLLLHQEYQSSMTDVALTKAKTRHAILSVLTTEQKTKWLSMKHQNRNARPF